MTRAHPRIPFALGLAGLLLALAWSGPAAAGEGMRCEGRLIGQGDGTYKVRKLCGDPSAVQTGKVERSVTRVVSYRCAEAPRGVCHRREEVAVQVEVQRWTYDLGSNRFVRYLTFEDGRLMLIESGGYGYD